MNDRTSFEPPRIERSRRDTIRLDVKRDVLYWAGTWGLTDQELRDAVAAVGPNAGDVADYLGQAINGKNLGDNVERSG
ncbi:DUF3606 domain-containing protein [Phenylobacterium sp.]|uniref:DUF3606 domain-containing protein n=1 Tax=Phenylobacterium sp. TaxID=1871053 RepID=UPI002F429532